MSKTKKIGPITSIPIKDDEYVKLVSHIFDLWDDARNKAELQEQLNQLME